MLLAIGEKMRGGVIAISFVAIIAVLMIVPLLYDYVSGAGKSDAIKVNSTTISSFEYSNRKAVLQQQLLQAFDGKLPEYAEVEGFLDKEVSEQLILESLLKEELAKRGYTISDMALRTYIQGLPAFQKDGAYDKETADAQLQSMGMSAHQFKVEYQQQLVNAQFQQGIESSAFVPAGELQNIAKVQFQTRDFAYAKIDAEAIRKTQVATKSELEDYFSANQKQFMHLEKVSVNYLKYSLADFKNAIKISKEQAKAEYDAGILAGRYTTAESRNVSHILFDKENQKLATEVLQKLKSGSISFQEAAQKYSQDTGSAENGGNLGNILRDGQMVKAFEDAVFSQQQGEIGPVVKSDFGWHIITINSISEQKKESFDSVYPMIVESLTTAQAQKILAEANQETANIAYEQADSLEPVAKYLNSLFKTDKDLFSIKTSDLFSNGAGAGIADSAKLRQVAFSESVLKQNNNSDLFNTENGDYVLLRVKEHQQQRPMSFDEAQEAIKQAVIAQKTQQQVNKISDEVLLAISKQDLAAVAKQYKLEYQQETEVNRFENPDIPLNIVQKVFEISATSGQKPAAIAKYGLANKAVIVLEKVNDGDYNSLTTSDREALTQHLSLAQGVQQMQATLQYLRSKAKIWINPNLAELEQGVQ